MNTRPTRSALALLSLVIVGTACESGTGPDFGDAFQATLDDYQALDAALGSPGFAGFQALGDRTPYGASAAMAAVGGLGEGPAFAQSLAARLADGPLAARTAADGGPAAAPIISEFHR